MVSKTVERSRRQRCDNFCGPTGDHRWCTVGLFQWNDVYSREIDKDWEDHWKQAAQSVDIGKYVRLFWIWDRDWRLDSKLESFRRPLSFVTQSSFEGLRCATCVQRCNEAQVQAEGKCTRVSLVLWCHTQPLALLLAAETAAAAAAMWACRRRACCVNGSTDDRCDRVRCYDVREA